MSTQQQSKLPEVHIRLGDQPSIELIDEDWFDHGELGIWVYADEMPTQIVIGLVEGDVSETVFKRVPLRDPALLGSVLQSDDGTRHRVAAVNLDGTVELVQVD
jgi:hypothetical protein